MLEAQVLETRRRVLGAEHPETVLSINNLGWTYMALQHWTEADELLVQAVRLRTTALGSEHSATLGSIQKSGTWLLGPRSLFRSYEVVGESRWAQHEGHGRRLPRYANGSHHAREVARGAAGGRRGRGGGAGGTVEPLCICPSLHRPIIILYPRLFFSRSPG